MEMHNIKMLGVIKPMLIQRHQRVKGRIFTRQYMLLSGKTNIPVIVDDVKIYSMTAEAHSLYIPETNSAQEIIKMNNKRLGKYGEDLAQDYLRHQGYKILRRNFRKPYGEIDIIARHNDYLVFVEVKTRSSLDYGRPSEAVNYKKRRTYSKLARNYICNYGFGDYPVRFDVIEIIMNNGDIQYNLITNAF